MIETENQEIRVEEIMSKIKKEIQARKTDLVTDMDSDDAFADEMLSSFDKHHLKVNFGVAEQNAAIGQQEFSMLRFHRLIRRFARLASRVVLYVSRIVTFPQTNFNLAVLNILQILKNGTYNLERRLNDDEREIHNLKELKNEVEKQGRMIQEQAAFIEKQDRTIQEYSILIEKQERINVYLKANVSLLESRLVPVLEDVKKADSKPAIAEQTDRLTAEAEHLFDPLYLSFEDQFRGSRQEIKERLTEYLPILNAAEVDIADKALIDIGCGRGEWLELMAENQRTAIGVDLNQTLVEQCAELGLTAVQADGIEYLRSLEDKSVGTVTAFHLIEHLSLDVLLNLLNEANRVLRPGGIAIFETPNPENVLVGSCNFYYDPTHQNPLPPQMACFLLESRGFANVEIRRLHPYPPETLLEENQNEVTRRFNQYFYGPQDYAVIGYKQ